VIKRSSFLFSLLFYGFSAIGQGDVDAILPKISAHRGASRVAPENTLAAFTKAIEMGADFIEIDVRTTSDGKQVCLHDASLKRTTGLNMDVKKVTLQKIKDLSAGEWFDNLYSKEKIPSLEEVCHLVAQLNKLQSRNVNLYVDCKDIRVRDVINVLHQYHLLDSAVFYGDVNTLKKIRKIAPSTRVMPAYPKPHQINWVILTLQPFAFDVAWAEVDSALVTDCHKKEIKVFSDLLGEDDVTLQYRKAIHLGIDLIQTDDVSSVQQIILEYKEGAQE
jgi:glycerophosphoryl diester phosphodiesterase